MKGNKLVIAVILALIVCLVLIPTCAFAEEGEGEGGAPVPPTTEQSGQQDGQQPEQPDGQPEEPKPEQPADPEQPATPPTEEEVIPSDDDEDVNPSDSGNKEPAEEESDGSGDVKEEPKEEDGASSGVQPEQPASQPEGSFKVVVRYGDKSYEMDGLNGGESFDLAQIARELGIEGDIESAYGNADELFSAASTEDGWKLITSKAFGTKQTLTLVVGGVEYTIDVEDDQTVNTIEELVEAVKNCDGGTIKIGADMILRDKAGQTKVEIPVGKTVTIDLNGKKLTYGSWYEGILNNGILTITDSSEAGTGTIKSTHSGCAIKNTATGVLTLSGGNYIGHSNTLINAGGKVTINPGVKFDNTLSDTNDVIYAWSSDVENPGTIEINGGEFKGAIDGGKNSRITINGGKFLREVRSHADGSLITINDGEFLGEATARGKGTTLIINGGTFNRNVYPLAIGGDVIINDGKFLGKVNAPTKSGKTDGTVTISGGTYKTLPDDMHITDGAQIIENPDGTYSIVMPIPKPAEDNKTETSASTTAVTASAPLYAKYLVLEGKGQQWADGDLEFVLNSNAVVKILIDGVEVEFTVAEDGTVMIASAVIEALEDGTHEIQFIFADGSCMTTFTK